jgi:HEAT repeat protein
MPRDQLLGLVADVDRLLAAGATAAVGNDGLSRRGRTLRELGQKVAALQPVADAIQRVTTAGTREVGRAFLDLVVVARQLRGSLAGTGPEGPLQVIESSDSWQTPMPARDVYNAHEALTADTSSSAMKDAAEREVTGDLRLLPSALAALESNKSSIADLMADKVLPAIGRGVLPDLLAKLDLTGKTADARRLRAICKIDPKIGAELCRKGLSEGSPALKIQALECLPDVGEPGEAEQVGFRLCSDKKKEVRLAALSALRRATGDEALQTLLEALGHEDAEIHERALKVLSELPHPRTTERLLREVKERASALPPPVAKPKKGAKKDAIKAAQESETVREKAVYQVSRFLATVGWRRENKNREVIETLLTMAGHSDKEVRRAAVAALAQMGPETSEVVPKLTEALNDSEFLVVNEAVKSLIRFAPEHRERAIPVLMERARDAENGAIVANDIAAILPAHMDRYANAILSLLRQMLKNRDLQPIAVHALEEIGPAARGLLPDLLAILESGEGNANFGNVFAHIEPEGTTSIPALVQLLGDRNTRVRFFALQGLMGYGPKAQAAEPLINKLLKDRDWSVKYTAEMALKAITGGFIRA